MSTPAKPAPPASLGAHPEAPLAPRSTAGCGGPARWLVEAQDAETVAQTVEWCRRAGVPLALLGGGSNTLVGDAGFPGVVLVPALRGCAFAPHPDGSGAVRLTLGAGEVWDEAVAAAVDRGLSGIEALSGIPGRCGAAPIQNIGAYGQEVGAVVETVQVFDRATAQVRDLAAAECHFGYRHSRFKADPDRFVVLALTLRLSPEPPVVRYAELAARLGPGAPTVVSVRAAVLALRRSKSMVWDRSDPNHRSLGSFFMNPVLPAAEAEAVRARVEAAGHDLGRWPWHPTGAGEVKLSAAWLVERAGFGRGVGQGPVGVSSRHSLALINRGGARATQLVAFARLVQAGVWRAFGVWLRPEPVPLGHADADRRLWTERPPEPPPRLSPGGPPR